MHEFSIALNIVDIAIETAKANNANKINEVEIDVGEISGIVSEALESALQVGIKGTMLENANIIIHKIRAEAKCKDCQEKLFPDDLVTACSNCGSFNIDIIKGKELRVKSINID